jgi:hypothetical protein
MNMNLQEFPTDPIITPPVKIERNPHKGFSITDPSTGESVLVDENYGSSDKPYHIMSTSLSPVRAGRLFFCLANLNLDSPRDIYAGLNGIVFRFNPAEAVPVQIHKFEEDRDEQLASFLHKGILEEIKPGLSKIID